MRSFARLRSSDVFSNVLARVGGLVALAIGTFIVARTGGPAAVGVYALLRVLVSLFGVLISAGLPGAVTYFLAGSSRSDPRLRPTIMAQALVGGTVAAITWLLATPVIQPTFFAPAGSAVIGWASIMVFTHLFVATAKSCNQGTGNLPGANRVILFEDLMFLPAYALVYGFDVRGYAAIVAGLLLGDAAVALISWARLHREGFFAHSARPSMELARSIVNYGTRAQIGGVIGLLNLRLDFLLLGALAGPAALGIYAVASKFAELLRLLPLALTYVLYPKFTSDGPEVARAKARALMPKTGGLTFAAALPLALSAGYLLPAIYGAEFAGAVVPAIILLVGLASEGFSSVATAYLYGIGRPGLNSFAMGAGLAVTVALDLLLVPPYGATGAAVASSASYITVTIVLALFFFRIDRSPQPERAPIGSLS
jgi:O-antigen/teichoic acid export membrane protein